MLLITFLALIATLTSVSGDCEIVTQKLKHFDWDKFTSVRPWYYKMHYPNAIENDLDCGTVTYYPPNGSTSNVSCEAYDISEKNYMTVYGYITNWNKNGYFEAYNFPEIWDGQYNIVALDNDRYHILKHCSLLFNETTVYVLYRTPHPDKETVNRVMKELEKNKIDVNRLADWSANHCLLAGTSTEK